MNKYKPTKYRITIERISDESVRTYRISAPTSKLAYQWGQVQRWHSFGDDGGMIEVKEVRKCYQPS